MSWGAVIAGGAAIVGGVASSKGAKDAAGTAADAEARALAFEQQRYDDWKAIYGPMEQNLADYYEKLTPEYYEAVGIEAVQSEYANVSQDISRSLAQRGMSDSGLATSLEQDAAISEAEAKADIRRSSESAVAADKMNFLSMGMGNNPASSLSSTYANIASSKGQASAYADQAAGQAWGNAINVIGTGLSDVAQRYTSGGK